MAITAKLQAQLEDPLASFRLLELAIAGFCITIPIWLYLADTWGNEWTTRTFRPSISNYVYMKKSYVFGMLLSIAAMLFLTNGAVYFRNEKQLALNQSGKWYNIVLGFSLFGVILFPHIQHPVPHYTFALLFFLGNAAVIGIFHQKQYRKISLILAVLTLVAFLIHMILPKLLSLLFAEWMSLGVIGIHQVLQAAKVIQFQAYQPPLEYTSQSRDLRAPF